MQDEESVGGVNQIQERAQWFVFGDIILKLQGSIKEEEYPDWLTTYLCLR